MMRYLQSKPRQAVKTAKVLALALGLYLVFRPQPKVLSASIKQQEDTPDPVDCSAVGPDTDIHPIHYKGIRYEYITSVPRWSAQIARGPEHQGAYDNLLAEKIYNETLEDEIYIDVGANVGQTCMPGLVSNRKTYCFEPIEFNVRKLCHSVHLNVEKGLASPASTTKVQIFHTLVGNESKAEVSISRPDDAFGKFEQASLAANTIGVARKPKLVTETIPMVTLDSIIPQDEPIGVIKIDVQGYELPVVQGMTTILSRKSGYPLFILYEEQARVTEGAGFKMGTVQAALEGYGYVCQRAGPNDILCQKPRPST